MYTCAEDPVGQNAEGAQTPNPNYELPHTRKKFLCFTKPDDLADWIDVRLPSRAFRKILRAVFLTSGFLRPSITQCVSHKSEAAKTLLIHVHAERVEASDGA